MKRSELIEIAILAVALITGYKFINSLYDLVIGAMFQVINGTNYGLKVILQYFFIMMIYLGVFIILIRKSKWLAAYIDKQGQIIPELLSSDAEKINISIHTSSLIYVVILAIGIASLLQQAPVLIMSLYNAFTDQVSPRAARLDMTGDEARKLSPYLSLSKIAFAAMLIYFARPLARWFASAIESPVIETTKANES